MKGATIATIPMVLLVLFSTLGRAGDTGVLDYRFEESSAISWFPVNYLDTRSAALGNISLFSSGAGAQLYNPAQRSGRDQFSLAVTGEYIRYQAFQYWGVNQGALAQPAPREEDLFEFGALLVNLPLGQWEAAAGFGLSGLLSFPDFQIRQNYIYDQYYRIQGQFEGRDRTWFLALARQITPDLVAGARLEATIGYRRVSYSELDSYYFWEPSLNQYVLKNIGLSRLEDHTRRFFRLALGSLYQASDRWRLGIIFRIPLGGYSDREITQSFANDYDEIHITIGGTGRDPLTEPWSMALATTMDIRLLGSTLKVGLEGEMLLAGDYEYQVLGERMPRETGNGMALKFGLEYPLELAGRIHFLRLGYRLENQPLETPSVQLHVFSGGIGISLWKLNLDMGMALYRTSGLDYPQQHLTAGTTLWFGL